MRNIGVIALGSNVAPKRNIPEAVKRIKDEFYVLRESAFVFTKPLGYADQPDFLNGAVLIQTSDDAKSITKRLKRIEQIMGRERTGLTDGPRKIDLDLVIVHLDILVEDVYVMEFLQHAIHDNLPDYELEN